jgi:hypothetical protein
MRSLRTPQQLLRLVTFTDWHHLMQKKCFVAATMRVKCVPSLIATATAERANLPWDFSSGIVIAKNPLDVLAHQWLSAEDSADAIARWTTFKNEPVSNDGLKGTP